MEDADAAVDDALLSACARGDGAALRELSARHAGMALGLALRLSGHRADAEDIVQEAFVRTWTHAARWPPDGAPYRGWLLQVVASLCRDRARRAAHRRDEPLDGARDQPDPAPLADTVMAERDQRASIVDAVRELPERQRQRHAVVLTYAGGLSNAATARSLGVSVEALLVRARRTLRDRLGGMSA